MKKIAALLLVVFSFVQTVSSMIPGPPILINCPKCGEEKELMSIISGNTIGATQWSDAYSYAPMLPRLSPVQKCSKCKNYFLLSKVETNYSDGEDRFNSDTGRLSYSDMRKAIAQLEKDSLSKDDEIVVRMELLHRYNDAFRENCPLSLESNDNMERNEEDKEYHISNINSLIGLLDRNNSEQVPFIAELYREAGDYSNCLSLLQSYIPESKYERFVVYQIIEKAEANDDKVFIINDD